ncbi:MAG TPA: ATP-binding protein [Pyrinomonadaceae bacterium]
MARTAEIEFFVSDLILLKALNNSIMLKELRLERFKKFKDLRIFFSPFTVLMGENSSGKTSILQALNLALISLHSYKLVESDGRNVKIRPKGVGLTKLPGFDLSDFRDVYYARISRATRVAAAEQIKFGANLLLTDEKDNKYQLRLNSLFGAFNISCASSPEDLPNTPTLQDKPPLFISGFVGLSAVEERIFPVALQDRLRLGNVSAVIRNLVFDMKENAEPEYQRLKKRMEDDFDFHLDTIEFNEEKDLYVTAQYSELCEEKNLSLDFSSSGSGFMQILQILAPIYRFCPSHSDIVLLDEPDAHLHPNLQTTLASSLRKIREELGIQIIISTHSTSIIRSASPSEVVPISAKARICKPLTAQSELDEEIRAKIDSYHLAKSVISGKLVFIEDLNTSVLERFDEVLNKKVFKGANTSPIIRGRGKTDRVPFQIREIIREVSGEEVEVIFVRDGDGLPPDWRERLSNFANERNVRLCILDGFEIESYLLNPNLILRTIQNKYDDTRGLTSESLTEKITELLKNTITLAKYNYRDDLEEEIRQVSLLLNLDEYRNPQVIQSEVRSWCERLENLNTLGELRKYGKGKETLKDLFQWLAEFGINLSVGSLIKELLEEDSPPEIPAILDLLQSNESRENPEGATPYDKEQSADDEIDVVKIIESTVIGETQPDLFSGISEAP